MLPGWEEAEAGRRRRCTVLGLQLGREEETPPQGRALVPQVPRGHHDGMLVREDLGKGRPPKGQRAGRPLAHPPQRPQGDPGREGGGTGRSVAPTPFSQMGGGAGPGRHPPLHLSAPQNVLLLVHEDGKVLVLALLNGVGASGDGSDFAELGRGKTGSRQRRRWVRGHPLAPGEGTLAGSHPTLCCLPFCLWEVKAPHTHTHPATAGQSWCPRGPSQRTSLGSPPDTF